MPIPAILKQFNSYIWTGSLARMPAGQRLLKRGLRIVHAVLMDLKDGQLSLRAMSLVYTTIISLVPLLAVSFSVLKGFGAHEQIKPALASALEPLGEKSAEITEKIIGFVDNIQVGVLGALGIALLLYTVIAMMQKIEHAFNSIWHVGKPRTLARRFSDYLSVLLIGPLFIFLSVGITTSARYGGVSEFVEAVPFGGHFLEFVSLLIPYFIMGAGFAFMYFYMPNTKVSVKSAFVGGLVTAIMWKLMGWFFTSFVAGSSNHTAVYSAFASVIVFMVFLYLGWLVLLIGSSISYYHQRNLRTLLARNDNISISPRVRERVAVLLMSDIARAFEKGEKPVTRQAMGLMLEVPEPVITQALTDLESAQLVREVDEMPGEASAGFVPARPLEKITLHDVVQAARVSGEAKSVRAEEIALSKSLSKPLDALHKAAEKKAKATTMKALVS